MKFLIVFSCALAFASAGYPYAYYAPQHIPLIDHNGVPVETPEVQAAKALHFAAHAAASHGTPLVYTGHHTIHVDAEGRPIDTPEVQLAKAAHFIAYNEAAIRNSYGGHYAAVAAGPIDTPEVQIAKAAHFAAHAEAKARSGHYRRRRQAGYYGPYASPVIGPNGVPVDTPEVQAEKAKHFALVAQAQTHNNVVGPQDHQHHGQYNGPTYDGQYGYHIPVIGPNGVPVETPAVQAEKAKHFAAFGGVAPAPAHAPAHQSYGGYQGPYATFGPNGPQDTPEVQAAKAAHLAAHSSHRHY